MPTAGRPNRSDDATWDILNALIGEIYECALHPQLWDDTLTRITSALSPLDWDVAFLIWEASRPPSARFVGSTGLAVGVPDVYSAVYAANNPWSERISSVRCGTVVDTDEIMSPETFRSSALYRDFLQRWSIERAVAVVLDRRGPERLALVLPGPAGLSTEGLKRGLRILSPHIQRAVRISHRIAVADLSAQAAGAAADRANFAIATLDRDLTILTVNRRAAEYEARGVVSLAGGRLSFCDAASQRRLIDLARLEPPAGTTFQALDRDGRECPVLGARIQPHTVRPLGGQLQGAALLVSIGGGQREAPALVINRLGAWFGLTPSEGKLASALAEGQTLADFTEARNISVNAARFLLKGVFRKTGAATQAQLAGLVNRLPN